jgi:hypothetical protein
MNKMMMVVAAVAVAGVMVAGQARAEAVPTLLLGTQSLNVSGMLGDNGDDFEIAMNGSYGYFYKDYIQAGAFGGVTLIGSDYKAVVAGVFGEYNVDLGTQFVPYAGGRLGLMWMDDGDSDTALEATGYGGARYFFVDYAAVGAQMALKLATEEMYNKGKDAVDWEITVNTSWYF